MKYSMNCSKPYPDLIFYLEGTLDEVRIKEIESHLSECTVCSAFLISMKNSLTVIEEEKKVLSNPFFYTRLSVKLEAKSEKKFFKLKRFIPALVAATLFAGGVITGINIAKVFSTPQYNSEVALTQERGYLDELDQEAIETYFLTTNEPGNE